MTLENNFKTIIEHMSESVWIGDTNERTVYANPNFCNLVGYPLEEILGRESYDFWDEESKKKVMEVNENDRVLGSSEGNASTYEGNLLSKTGEKIPVFLSGAPLPDGGSVGIMTDLREINATKQIAEYQKAIDATSIFSKSDLNGNITYVNDNFCSISGYTREELLGQQHNIVRHPDMDAKVYTDLWAKIQSKKVWKGVIKNKKKDGGYYWVFSTVLPILGKDNEIVEYISFRTDITKEKALEEKFKVLQANEIDRLKEISELKDKFLYMATHELRTPLTSVKGYLSMMIDGDIGNIDNEARGYLKKVYGTTNRLIDLISELLDLRKIESGKEEFIFEDIDLLKLLNDTYEEMLILANNKDQKLSIDLDFDKFIYNTDVNKLRQVLLNLLSNSIKYTQDGGKISIYSYLDNNNLIISIKDNGFGISKENQKKLFEEFSRIHTEQTKGIVGTGLGLPITKKIIEKLGGNIIVESEVGKGSEFKIILPIK